MSLIRRRLPVALVALFAVVAASAFANTAVAQNNYFGAVRIENPSDTAIHYQVKWGADGEWKDYTVEAGFYYQHTWEYDYANQNASPVPFIRYDNIGGNGQYDEKVFRLEPYAVSTKGSEAAHRYHFEYGRDGRVIYLQSDN